MEMKLMNPQIIGYAMLLSAVMLLVWRRRKKFKKGIIVANSKYVRKTFYFKYLFVKYHFINILVKATCILIIFIAAVLTARLYKSDRHEETKENRDIMLCMDVSGSVYNLDAEIIDSFIDIISNLKDERFGLVAFDSTPVTIIPLTTDYDYAISVLKELKMGFDDFTNASKSVGRGFETLQDRMNSYNNLRLLFAGATSGKGSSLIGDGLAYSCSTFKQNDGRPKVVVFTTDNELAGTAVISLEDAAGYCKNNDIKVYPIGTKTIMSNKREGLVNVANVTGGKYYDYKDFSTDEIVKDVQKLNKAKITTNVYITNQEFPELIFPYILYLIPVLLLLSWRVRI